MYIHFVLRLNYECNDRDNTVYDAFSRKSAGQSLSTFTAKHLLPPVLPNGHCKQWTRCYETVKHNA